MAQCATCGASLKPGSTRCVKCGSAIESGAPPAPQPVQSQQQYAPPPQQYGAPQPQVIYVQQAPPQVQTPKCTKSKVTAGILALLLGGLGFHKFYLGKIGQGILYLIFCWTYVPASLGLCEGIYYLTMKEEVFCQKYGQK